MSIDYINTGKSKLLHKANAIHWDGYVQREEKWRYAGKRPEQREENSIFTGGHLRGCAGSVGYM